MSHTATKKHDTTVLPVRSDSYSAAFPAARLIQEDSICRDEVDPAQVKSEWMADQHAEYKRIAFDELKARYKIALPGTSPGDKAHECRVNGVRFHVAPILRPSH